MNAEKSPARSCCRASVPKSTPDALQPLRTGAFNRPPATERPFPPNRMLFSPSKREVRSAAAQRPSKHSIDFRISAAYPVFATASAVMQLGCDELFQEASELQRSPRVQTSESRTLSTKSAN